MDDPKFVVPFAYILLVLLLATHMCLSMFDALNDKRVPNNVRRNIIVVLFFNVVVAVWSASYIF